MDKFRIDSHKLMYHIPRLQQWLGGKEVYPIYAEIGLFGGCNHRCVFCAFDFIGYQADKLQEGCLKKFITQAAKKGLKAILYSGEGEPLLHNKAPEIFNFTKKAGIDVALVTNGVLLTKEVARASLGSLAWVKVSLDAGSKKTYKIIHRANENDFETVLDNLKSAIKIKRQNKYNCTVGVQMLLLPQNYREVESLAGCLKGIGVDYLVVKPYSPHPLSNKKINSQFKYKDMFFLEERLAKYSQDKFQVIFRKRAMENGNQDKPYRQCLGLSFATHITAQGDIYPCNAFVGREEFIFGNIYKDSFQKIWTGARRKRVMAGICKTGIKDCRQACRLDEINKYLWELKNPGRHVNFI
jgi:GTP 3',8-cyclase